MGVSPSRVPNSIRGRRALLAALAAAAVLPAGSASAASVSLKISDSASDSTGGTGTEITAATITQDTSAGNVTATITTAAAPTPGASIAIGLGKLKSGACSVGEEGDGSMVIIGVVDSPPTAAWVIDGSTAPGTATASLSGSTIKITTGSAASLKKLAWNCANVAIQTSVGDSGDAVGDSATGSGSGSGQVVVTTDKPDADKDGVPDVADACPSVAGSTANGCLSIAAKLAYRLGAKRVAIDVMVPNTGATCKAVAKATVKDGSKTIGKGNLEVGVHGSFCHISGAIKTKKHGKKVKLAISGSGFKKISKSIKK